MIFIITTFLCLLISTVNGQSEPKNGHTRSVEVDGKKMVVYTKGIEKRKAGEPVVIFENGLGMTLNNWDIIFDEVAKHAPFLAYDRTGNGKSERDGELPTLKHNSDRLKRLLTVMKIDPPYLIVGHSMGAVYARGYAIYYPKDLAGLIFVDPGDFTETREAYNVPLKDIGRTTQQIEDYTRNRLSQPKNTLPTDTAPVREIQVLRDLRWTDWKEITDAKLPNVPVQFIIGGKFTVAPENQIKEFDHETYFRARQVRAFERFAKVVNTVRYGKVLYSANAGHFVQTDDPELVISSIKTALNDYQRLLKDQQ